MVKKLMDYFKTGQDNPLITDNEKIKKIYERKRWSVTISIVLGYAFFYTCKLGLSIAKKPMLDAGILDVKQMGIIGAVLLYVYAFGKFTNGFLADRINVRKFMSAGLMVSALINLIFGMTSYFFVFIILWGLNGWVQSMGSAPSVVSICQWFSNKERGTRYGMWAGAHSIGEGITFIGTSVLVSILGWRWGFIGPGLVCVIISSIMFYTLADRPQTYGLPHVADYKKDYSAGKVSKDDVKKLQLMVLKSPVVWVLGLSSAFMYVARYAIHSWGPLYLQVVKNYSLADAGILIGSTTMFGFTGAIFSGFFSDRFFNSRRNVPALLYGLLLTISLVLIYITPSGNRFFLLFSLGCFEFAVGGLIVFLAGLIAVDIMPVKAAGAVKGVIGLFSYFGAATQDWISGYLIDLRKTVVDGNEIYNFDYVFYFWIGTSILSLILALIVWNVKPHE